MQDNSPAHKKATTLEAIAKWGIEVMEWPPQSPDLNIIENVWAMLSSHVYANGRQYTSITELWESVKQEWSKLCQSDVTKLVETMERRLEQVYACNGSWTDW